MATWVFATENGRFCGEADEIHLMLFRLKNWLSHPLMHGHDLDSLEANAIRKQVILSKPFLESVYKEWYSDILNALPSDRYGGTVVEIGSGGGFLKEYIPDLITSEILKIPNMDIVLDGHDLPFKKSSLSGIVMIDVFHHLKRVQSFLNSAAYCVRPGGVIVMIEPWNTVWSRFVYTYLHHESFDNKIREWELPEGGPLSQANSALPWIVFSRDRDVFKQKFPTWHLKQIKLHTPFRYLVSGGVSMISFSPKFLYTVWCGVERLFRPYIHLWAMFATIRLVRTSAPHPF